MTTLSTKKPTKKISTTVRFDPILKSRAERFAKRHHMDFTTFLHFSLQSTLETGVKIEPEMSDERYQYYCDLADRAEKGLDKTYGPFEGKAAIDFLKSLY